MSTHPVGQVRPSQILWTYGPGALIDLPNLSVITMGLDHWNADDCPPVEEARLLAAVRRILGPQVVRLRIPPFVLDESADPHSAAGKIGVPVRPFPRFLRCVKCGLLAAYDSGLFTIKVNDYRPEYTHFVHENCEKGGKPDAVPARFLLACRNGHLDDFPWHWYVHGGPSSCQGTLRFFESGASMQTENLKVKCDGCNTTRSLVHAFGEEATRNLPACRCRHPHLDSYDRECDQPAKAVLLGSTNSWFPISLSVLAIPPLGDPLAKLIDEGWDDFFDVESEAELKGLLKGFVKRGILAGIEKFSHSDIWEAIKRKREGGESDEAVTEEDIKGPEWDVLIAPSPPSDWPHFLSRRVPVPSGYTDVIDDVLLLERLREVNALVGYTRVEAPDETMDTDERPPMAHLTGGRAEWVPASEVHGEGIFIRFSEHEVSKWERTAPVLTRSEMLERGHREWRAARQLDPNLGFPGVRYAMLHTLAHLLVRELALECGYNAASIRERIYSSDDKEKPMAGILLYTAAADSDGTLGGLVELGKPDSLGRLLNQALSRATVCSSDPLCAEHDAGEDRSLHNASCHACTFVAETSCERGNRYLDRALLIETLECKDAWFFSLEGGSEDSSLREAAFDEMTDDSIVDDGIVSCKLIDVESKVSPNRLIRVIDENGRLFRCPDEDEEVVLKRGDSIVLSHPDLRMKGNPVQVVAGRVIAVKPLVDPETGERTVQVTLRCNSGTCVLKVDEVVFDALRPLCIAVKA